MDGQERKLVPHLSQAGAWAMALGTSVGWGSLVVTSNTYLVKAGPLGTVFGLLAGALMMLLICRNYAYMMKMYPGAGGAYVYVREVFGYDRAFVASWFLALVYLAMLWANATALPLFLQAFRVDVLRFGELYTLFDYPVYLGEVLLTVAAIVLVALLCARSRKTRLSTCNCLLAPIEYMSTSVNCRMQ